MDGVTEQVERDGEDHSAEPNRSTYLPHQLHVPAVLGPDGSHHHQAAIQRDGREQEGADEHVEEEAGGVDPAEGRTQHPGVSTGHVEGEERQEAGGQEVRRRQVQDPDADDGAANTEANNSEDEDVFYDADGGDYSVKGDG